jgi:hypothetical protein
VPACAQALCETAIILSLALLPFLLLSVARTYTEAIRGADGGLRGRPPLHRRERRAAGRQLTSPTAGKEERSSHPARLARSGARQPARGTGLGDRNRRSRNRHVTMVGAGGGREGELRADPWLEGRAGRERAQGRIARTVLGPFFSALCNGVRGRCAKDGRHERLRHGLLGKMLINFQPHAFPKEEDERRSVTRLSLCRTSWTWCHTSA